MTKPKFVLDTNAAIFLIANKEIFPSVKQAVDDADVFVSVITRIELLAKPGITSDELRAVIDFLAEVTVIPLDAPVETATIELRRANPKIKLPDAIIAATAIALKATVISSDPHLLNLPSPGFSVQSFY